MSEVLIGTIIGAMVGVISSIISAVITIKTVKYQMRIKQYETFEIQKIEVLLEFMSYLGGLNNPVRTFSTDQYFSAANKAACLVSEDTRELIFHSMQLVHDQRPLHDYLTVQKALSVLIQRELDGAKTCIQSRSEKPRKRYKPAWKK